MVKVLTHDKELDEWRLVSLNYEENEPISLDSTDGDIPVFAVEAAMVRDGQWEAYDQPISRLLYKDAPRGTTEVQIQLRPVTEADPMPSEEELIEVARRLARTRDPSKVKHYYNQGKMLLALYELEKQEGTTKPIGPDLLRK